MTNQWQAWVNVKWKPGTPETAWQSWAKNKWVKGVWTTTGNWDCTVWIDCKTPADLEKFVWSSVRGNKWVETTDTIWAKPWYWADNKKSSKAA